ncbi:putative protein phosphatase 2C 73 isoform X2 [Wolffia australiana]
MELIPGLLSALAKSLQGAKKKTSIDEGRKAAEAMAREARKNGMILRSSGSIVIAGSSRFISCSSRRGEKGMNQDFSVVWKDFGCQEDLMFCGIFDGHGSWGREVARLVGEFLPSFLLCNWQETLVLNDRMDEDLGPAMEKKLCLVDVWKRSYLRACAAMDREISLSKSLDPFYSGSTALTAIIQGDLLVLANVGDSRAVLATSDASGRPVPVQLSLDFKPSLPAMYENCISNESSGWGWLVRGSREDKGEQGASVLLRGRAGGGEGVAAMRHDAGPRHVPGFWGLLCQGLWPHLHPRHHPPHHLPCRPLPHPRHRRGVGCGVQYGGGADCIISPQPGQGC